MEAVKHWDRITALWFCAAVVLTAGSLYLYVVQDVPFARPPHPWNKFTIHLAGPWVIWAVSGWLARRS
jgi:hypothetical protein